MKERPILFKGEMVRRILVDRKTQTRRLVKMQSDWHGLDLSLLHVEGESVPRLAVGRALTEVTAPLGQPGERLWVRETFGIAKHTGATIYRADGGWSEADGFREMALDGGKWKPSIFMPRALSRINLGIIRVGVERLQDISDADCIDEGVVHAGNEFQCPFTGNYYDSPRAAFRCLWRAVNGPASWDQNPWLWKYTFKRESSGC